MAKFNKLLSLSSGTITIINTNCRKLKDVILKLFLILQYLLLKILIKINKQT
jgi:hypothetical protein